jgi:signal transduction histidine kinase
VAVRPFEFKTPIPWRNRDEPPEQAGRRRSQQRAQYATGLLATFLDGELFFNEFNSAAAKTRVQLFTSTNASADTCLNPGHAMPLHPRHSQDARMRWYGKSWTARVASTPVFEAASLGYRTTVIWGAGILLTLGVAAVAAWQTRGRWREASLAAQLREALGRQERLSRDLHDGTLQSVYGVGLSLQRAQRQLELRPADAARQITETTNALQRVIGELRGFIRETDPGAREEVPLGEALAGVVAHQRHSTEMALELQAPPEADRGLNAAQSLELLNIAREALSNSIRHSGGRRVQLILDQAPGVLRLQIADDGCGFDPNAAQSKGHGLRNLAVRVRELGGTHRWESAAGDGCRLIVEVPLPSATGGSSA